MPTFWQPALYDLTAMHISTREHDLSPFYPLRLSAETRLVLGADMRYELLVVSAIQEITPLSETFKLPETIYVQTSDNNAIRHYSDIYRLDRKLLATASTQRRLETSPHTIGFMVC